MPSVVIPLVQTPPFVLIALALIQGIPVGWDTESGETGQATYGEIKGAEEVRKELEKGIDGKEIPLPPLPTLLAANSTFQEVSGVLDALDDYLAYRTYFAGSKFGFGDAIIWGTIRGNTSAIGSIKKPGRPHLARWFNHVETLSVPQNALKTFQQARSEMDKGKKTKRLETVDVVLPNAVKGKVVVRFAPEPSGFLHIGHLKAAILNRFLADQYQGKFILRFDDTNPLKEEGEFEDAIKQDLEMIEIGFDKVVHTSDHFDKIQQFTEQLIRQGDAFMDDTDGETVKEQRRAEIPSKNRDASIEENLARFKKMLSGSDEGKKWSLRAKIDYQHKNGSMRDPVVYRYVEGSHHITGTQYKAYPMYDLACPIIDHLDGVTHALRANEYYARHEQYQWFLEKLGFPKIEIFDFSRVDFVYTVLSKRKLKYLVEKGVVGGWDDPRFPTVRGIRSRGMTVQGLKNYILGQGASQAQLSLEWDGIWTVNKKVIDPIAPRYWAIAEDKAVPVSIKGLEGGEKVEEKPLHKKNPEIGNKKVVYSDKLLIEQEDAVSFGDNEEITAMDWGNVFVSNKKTSTSGEVESLEFTLHLEGDFKKTSKKIHWLSAPSSSNQLVPVTLIEYDYLITKKKLEENDNLEDVINPKTEYRTKALASPEVASLKKWDIIQFERKGYYICQGTKDSEGRLEFGFIPDGRLQTISLKATPAVEKPKVAGASKGSWGKPGPTTTAAPAAATTIGESKDDTKILLSNGSSGFKIPVKTGMFESDKI
ncbi:glutamate-tRNA ligase [Kwoniella mangroviensis CBS 8507]|uniref:glutamate-tRNA ligase n=1 Tax=Kwoniella mangroviensis CBS 8507 TaxID=1296122 RepID=UPI00080D130B|nr:glutamate-tRNA ligase [Kwoniella mangroviensis CBS 8507]OCF62924.1 glutamate-tRNA ligase [Kwoniella mangroviensis CBS 8507]